MVCQTFYARKFECGIISLAKTVNDKRHTIEFILCSPSHHPAAKLTQITEAVKKCEAVLPQIRPLRYEYRMYV